MKVLLPSSLNLQLDSAQFTATAGSEVEAVPYDEGQPIPAEHRDAQVFVTWANTRANLASAASDLTELKLVQTISAGTDKVLAAGFAPSVQVASGRSLHDVPVAEHTLALTLATVRRLDQLAAAQRRHDWDRDFVSAQSDPERGRLFTLNGAHVVIWGFGSIAQRLAPMLKALGANVTGIANSAGDRDGFPVVATQDRGQALADADILISMLPATPQTERSMDAETIAMLPDSAIFINVGRGATVDESALIEALENGALRVAALDVMDTEPLPADSPLWEVPNLILTPHVAGGRPQHSEVLIDENLTALREGTPLRNLVRRH